MALVIAVILIIATMSISYINFQRIKSLPPSVSLVRVNDDINITILSGTVVTLTAIIDDTTRGDSIIQGANYSVGLRNWPASQMEPVDGLFNETIETVTVDIDTGGWTDGTYHLYIYGIDELGNGNFTPNEHVTLVVTDPPHISNVSINGQSNIVVAPGSEIIVNATLDDSLTGGSTIKSAFITIDDVKITMEPEDEDFDSSTECVSASLSTQGWLEGSHEIVINAYDDLGNEETTTRQSTLLAISDPPLISDIRLSNRTVISVAPGVPVELTARIDDTDTGNTPIYNAWFTIDNSTVTFLEPVDGQFDNSSEEVRGTIMTEGLSDDVYDIQIFASDTIGGSDVTAQDNTLLTIAAPPEINNVTIDGFSEIIVVPGGLVEVRAIVDDTDTGNSTVDAAYITYGNGTVYIVDMYPTDGSYDSPREEVFSIIDTSSWPNGTHFIQVRARDIKQNINETGCHARLIVTAPFRMFEYDLILPEYSNRSYTWETLNPVITTDVDSDGVPKNLFNGELHYHPVAIAQYALRMLDSYILSGNESYYNISVSCLHRLINESHSIDGALYVPYTFDFALHGHADQMMIAPWYSGMAQGQFLSLLSRIIDITGDEYYLDVAEKVFRSFYNLEAHHTTWTVYSNSHDYYWISEYPMIDKTQVLNGFVWATYGLLDYYFLVNSSLFVNQLLRAALTSIQDHVLLYRRVGNLSIYCLKHQVVSVTYHMIHIEQQETLFHYTNEAYFHDMSVTFYNDWH
ncbi:MAG: hypothetical protein AYK23_00335 [Candidatus Proteinoplasmatales archaeon SG8-5]|nr:MAG: hypothetical protein AYK23_00335 [Candidatus Proteinoplasmatales archaeon SG8-5]